MSAGAVASTQENGHQLTGIVHVLTPAYRDKGRMIGAGRVRAVAYGLLDCRDRNDTRRRP